MSVGSWCWPGHDLMARRGNRPPIPLLHQGSCLNDREFEAAYCQLDEYIVLDTRSHLAMPSRRCIPGMTMAFKSCLTTWELRMTSTVGMLVKLTSQVGGLLSTRVICAGVLRKESRKTIHVQKWAANSKEDAHSLLQAWATLAS